MSIVDEPEKWVNLEIVADHTEKQTFIMALSQQMVDF